VKIDGSYVSGKSEHVDNQLFVRTLIGLADGLGLFTVAECVENDQDAALLTRRGVRFMQGWRFGKPSLERPWAGEGADAAARQNAPVFSVVNGGRSAL
jgi:EAL domain-containing protein (putative c-di-GMP-specific phosphodiesterase class I)